MKLRSGRSNLAITLFVPWDCNNNCPFCTTKKEYKDASNFSLPEQIKTFDCIFNPHRFQIPDIVITGGEPFADLNSLRVLLIHIVSRMRQNNLYINTSDIVFKNKDDLDMCYNILNQFRYVIRGVNISKHIHHQLEGHNSPHIINMTHTLNIPMRINCVLDGTETVSDLQAFIDTWHSRNRQVCFRKDYRTVKSEDDLHGIDSTVRKLEQICGHWGVSGCEVCCTNVFENLVLYHRGTERTLVTKENYLSVNDIIIKQDGGLYLDWDNRHKIMPEDFLKNWENTLDYTKYERHVGIPTNAPDFGSCGGSIKWFVNTFCPEKRWC